jgi:hypothetical protein
MRNLAVITLTICMAALLIQLPALAADKLHHQRGLEFRAGFSHQFMEDPNDFVDAYPSNYDVTNTLGSPTLGLSLLYKTHEHFGWNIGYNYLMTNTSKAELGDESLELKMRGHELFVMGCYIKPVMTDWELILGLGLNGFFGWMDQDDSEGVGFNDAGGRSLGFLVNAGLEMPLKEKLGLAFALGYRNALVDEIAYRDANDRERTVYFENRPMELNFSGLYGQIGLRVYFDPVTDWKQYED